MKSYQCHKIVQAMKIGRIEGCTLYPEDPILPPVTVTTSYIGRWPLNQPGYYVKYEDGYESFSPAKAFEEGYTPIDDDYVPAPGHFYALAGGQTLQFLDKRPGPTPQDPMVLARDGTTNEEVLRALIDRTSQLNAKFPCRENAIAITKMEEALLWFEHRTRQRLARGVEGKAVT